MSCRCNSSLSLFSLLFTFSCYSSVSFIHFAHSSLPAFRLLFLSFPLLYNFYFISLFLFSSHPFFHLCFYLSFILSSFSFHLLYLRLLLHFPPLFLPPYSLSFSFLFTFSFFSRAFCSLALSCFIISFLSNAFRSLSFLFLPLTIMSLLITILINSYFSSSKTDLSKYLTC
jgi:hypothetical protein